LTHPRKAAISPSSDKMSTHVMILMEKIKMEIKRGASEYSLRIMHEPTRWFL
jgi:hypothetical protein